MRDRRAFARAVQKHYSLPWPVTMRSQNRGSENLPKTFPYGKSWESFFPEMIDRKGGAIMTAQHITHIHFLRP